jgi:hypothetical protein
MGAPETIDGTLEWDIVSAKLAAAKNYWIGTTSPTGAPHAVPMWAAWVDDALYIGVGGHRTKRNLARDPRVSIHLESGTDVVIVEGVVDAPEAIDEAAYTMLVEQFTDKYQWNPAEEAGYERTGSGWRVVRVSKVLAWTNFPADATRFTPTS